MSKKDVLNFIILLNVLFICIYPIILVNEFTYLLCETKLFIQYSDTKWCIDSYYKSITFMYINYIFVHIERKLRVRLDIESTIWCRLRYILFIFYVLLHIIFGLFRVF